MMPAKELMPGIRLVSWSGTEEKLLRARTHANESHDDAFWRIIRAGLGLNASHACAHTVCACWDGQGCCLETSQAKERAV